MAARGSSAVMRRTGTGTGRSTSDADDVDAVVVLASSIVTLLAAAAAGRKSPSLVSRRLSCAVISLVSGP